MIKSKYRIVDGTDVNLLSKRATELYNFLKKTPFITYSLYYFANLSKFPGCIRAVILQFCQQGAYLPNASYLCRDIMDAIEKIKLVYRANRFKSRNDKTEIRYIADSLVKGQTAIDIGAHKGGYLYNILKQVGPEGFIYAFEPQTILYNYLSKLKSIFKWQNVVIEHKALSDGKGKVTLFIPFYKGKTTSPGASIVGSENFNEYHTEEVETETLDSYCQANKIRPGFLKVDVEGNELKVFKGGAETLKEYRPKILFECEERHVGKEKVLETFHFLKGLGYEGRFIAGDQIKPLLEFDFAMHQNKEIKPYCNNFIFE